MKIRPLLLSFALVLLATACQPGEPPVTSTAPPIISGRYDVKGVTATRGSPEKRKISGAIILVQEGSRYRATFELKTTFPTHGADTAADVIGVGEGEIEAGTLTGRAQTQLVVATVPGMDTGFAYIPRSISTRIISSSVARIENDGSILIDIENQPAEGESYTPTHTRLAGHRVLDERPDVAARE